MPRKTLDPILIGIPAPVVPTFENIGSLLLQLDDGNYTAPVSDMTAMENQAINGLSGTWTADQSMVVSTSSRLGGRDVFFTQNVSEGLSADTPENGFKAGGGIWGAAAINIFTLGVHTGPLVADVKNLGGSFWFGSGGTGEVANKINNGSSVAISTTAILGPANTDHVIVWEANTTQQKCYVDAVDETLGGLAVWDGVTDFSIDKAMFSLGASSWDYYTGGLYFYSGVPTSLQKNQLGQLVADNFGFTQTWNVT